MYGETQKTTHASCILKLFTMPSFYVDLHMLDVDLPVLPGPTQYKHGGSYKNSVSTWGKL